VNYALFWLEKEFMKKNKKKVEKLGIEKETNIIKVGQKCDADISIETFSMISRNQKTKKNVL